MNYNRRSKNITEGVARAPNRSMYYAMGYEDDDFSKPMIGVANGHSHHHALQLAACRSWPTRPSKASKEAGANAQIFGTPTISDGMAMGTEGMKYSLVSREVIADCVETCVGGQWMDGVLVIGGCDKNMPGGMMGMLRANVPAIYVYGGTILPGHYKGQDLNIVSVFEAVGQFSAGNMSEEDFCQIERRAIPGSGSLRRHVHRQHHELGLRGAGHEPALLVAPWPTSHDEKVEHAPRSRRGAGRGGQEGPEAARHRHAQERSRTPSP